MSDEITEKPHHPSLCLLNWTYPVVSLGRSEVRHCCRTPLQPLNFKEFKRLGYRYFSENEYVLKRRKDSLSGVRHKDCDACWKLEDKGAESGRGGFVDFLNYQDGGWRQHYSRDPHEALEKMRTQLNLENKVYPLELEISLNNLCNMKCVYCNQFYSSQWESELLKYGEISKRQLYKGTPGYLPEFEAQFWKWLEKSEAINTLERIIILGGEPLITPAFYTFVEKLFEQLKKNRTPENPLTLAVVTNLNLKDKQFQSFLNLLEKTKDFLKVDLCISMDSVEEKAEYIRHGLNWDQWLANFNQVLLKNPQNTTISLQITLSCLNLTSLHELIELAYNSSKKFRVPIYLRKGIVSYPHVHSPFSVPSEMSVPLLQAIKFMEEKEDEMAHINTFAGGWSEYKRFLKDFYLSHRSHTITPHDMKSFYKWFSTNDQRRGSDFLATFPEMKNFWELCRAEATLNKPSGIFSFFRRK